MAGTAARPLLCVTSCPEDRLGLEPGLGPQYGDQNYLYVHAHTVSSSCLDTPSLGVLHSGSADFESVDDLVEAVGELLQEVSGDSKVTRASGPCASACTTLCACTCQGRGIRGGDGESGRSGDKT